MTVPSSRPTKCQHCGQDNEIVVYESINSHDRHLHDKLVSGALWRWRCKSCAKDGTAIYPLLYHDMRAWCLIYYLDRNMTDDPGVIARLVPGADQLVALRRFNATYRFRLCRSLDDFIEKVRILDAGLDDRAIEYLRLTNLAALAKTAANSAEKALAQAGMSARFERVLGDDPKTLDFGPCWFPSTPLKRAVRMHIPFAVYADALARINGRLGSETGASSGFIIVDRSYIEERFPETTPKRADATAPRDEPPGDMGSVVFGKTGRAEEARKSWWRFW